MADSSHLLKDATKQAHRDAERSNFFRLLLSGKLTEQQWLDYLVTQYMCYLALESAYPRIDRLGLTRRYRFLDDIKAMGNPIGHPTPGARKYIDYVGKLDDNGLLAHTYVRYLGDLYGGQMIAKKIHWPRTHLEFNQADALITKIRDAVGPIQHALVGEAITCFRMVGEIYNELAPAN